VENEGATKNQELRQGDEVGCEGQGSNSQGRRASSSQELHRSFSELLELPRLQISSMPKAVSEPQIDYQKSILLTQEQHMKELEDLATKREAVAAERERWQLQK